MAKPIPPTYYILHGEDEFSRKLEVKAMRARMGTGTEADLNIKEIDGTQGKVADVLSDARSFPFLSDKRLVLVYGMLSWLTRKGAGKEARADLEALVAALPGLPEWARVVFIEEVKLAASHPVMKLLQTDSHGFEKEFTLPHAKEMAGWITRRVVQYNTTIETRAAVLLAEMIGPDYRAADSELDKLAIYAGGDRAINESDVTELTAGNAEASIFLLVDQMGTRHGREAATTLHRLLDAKEDPLRILGMVNRQFRLLLQAKSFLADGGDVRELAEALDQKSYVTTKLNEQIRYFTIEQLEGIYRSLLDIDWKIKTGQIDGVLALDLLVAGLAS